LLQLPVESQVLMPLPEHWVAPGVQTPLHAPFTHAEFEHAWAADQDPVASHVCTALPEQRVVPGLQVPVHEPSTQA
jgi:hypothetical protein